ncbi:hypothetical protein [Streptomyces daliensis]
MSGDKGSPEHLSTDLADSADGPGRRAEVYFYDYGDDTLVHKTVLLGEGGNGDGNGGGDARSKVEDSEVSRGAQPPPAWREAREAATVLLGDPLGAGLKRDYEKAMGKKLTGAGQLSVQGLTYVPRGTPEGPLARCGDERCVRLFTRVADGPWIDTQRLVVNLSARTVHRLP